MNCLQTEATSLAQGIIQLLKKENVNADHIILAPPFPYISAIATMVSNVSKLEVAAQNCSDKAIGAYTGEVSAAMLNSAGAAYVIVGHSERRAYYHETDELIATKIKMVLSNGMVPIFCCGESLDQRKSGIQNDVVKQQMETALFSLSKEELEKVIVAYEPVWAIGTGETATPSQAQEMHGFIRSVIEMKYGIHSATIVPVLYGGSCNEKNAKELFALPDVDGGLIGGGSLKAESFVTIIKSFPA